MKVPTAAKRQMSMKQFAKNDCNGGRGTYNLTAGAHDMLWLELEVMVGYRAAKKRR